MILLDRDYWGPLVGAIVASSEAAALPASSTTNAQRTSVWRSLEESGEQFLQRDFGTAYTIDAVGLANLRLLPGGAIVIESLGASTEPGSATTLATITAEDEETRVVLKTFTPVSVRHLRLRWTNPGSMSDYAECGVVRAGESWTPAGGEQSPDWMLLRSDPSILVSSPGGQVTATERPRFATGQFQFRWDSASADGLADLARFRTLWRRVGNCEPFFFQTHSQHAWTAIFGRFASDRSISVMDGNVTDITQPWQEAL